jgi:GNAT superfamily N-acetyltransferase
VASALAVRATAPAVTKPRHALIRPTLLAGTTERHEHDHRAFGDDRGRPPHGIGVTPRIEWFEGSRDELSDLFTLADDSAAAVRTYRALGRVLVASDGPTVIGHLQLVAGDGEDEAAVKSLAIREARQGAGVGRLLVARAVMACREEHRSTLLVATAAADTRVLRFYQRLGFRLLRVERDAFTPETGYPEVAVDGIPLRDRVWLSLTL